MGTNNEIKKNKIDSRACDTYIVIVQVKYNLIFVLLLLPLILFWSTLLKYHLYYYAHWFGVYDSHRDTLYARSWINDDNMCPHAHTQHHKKAKKHSIEISISGLWHHWQQETIHNICDPWLDNDCQSSLKNKPGYSTVLLILLD